MAILQKVLRIGARRDAAFEIPLPPADLRQPGPRASEAARAAYKQRLQVEWWPRFEHHAHMVVAARHLHEHCATCLQGKRGKTGCRMCATWGHDVDKTRLTELRVMGASVDEACTVCTDGPEESMLRRDCRCCHADGARDDRSLDAATRQQRLVTEANRRSLYYTVHEPSPRPPGGRDDRTLALELARPLLPEPRGAAPKPGALEKLVRDSRDGRRPTFQTPSDGRRCLREVTAGTEPLGLLLAHPELSLLRSTLAELAAEPMAVDAAPAAEDADQQLRRDKRLRAVLEALTDPSIGCRQGRVVDCSVVVAGCCRGNAMLCSLGAGAGSKSTAMYQIKYASKESVEISGVGTTLIDAHAHNKEYTSAAADAGTEEREARRFAQRVINSAAMELEAVQAAGLVLGMGSSGSSHEIEYHSIWDARKLAQIVAEGVYDDVDFSHGRRTARDRVEDAGHGGGHVEDSGDDEERHIEDSDDDEGGGVAAAARGGQRPAGQTIDLLDHFQRAEGIEGGHAIVYDDGKGGKVAVSAAHHYAYRAVRLVWSNPARWIWPWPEPLPEPEPWALALSTTLTRASPQSPTPTPTHTQALASYQVALNGFSAYEFSRGYNVRKMTTADQQWRDAELSGEGHGPSGAGRPCDRYLLREPHPLRNTHLVVKKARRLSPATLQPCNPATMHLGIVCFCTCVCVCNPLRPRSTPNPAPTP